MRIVLMFLLLCVVGFVSLQAQTKTYDIKINSQSDSTFNGFRDFKQISPEHFVARAYDANGNYYLVTINSDGMVDHSWKVSFGFSDLISYHYNPHSGVIVLFATEQLSYKPRKEQLRLVLLDSTLIEKSNSILDSVVTGLPTQFGDSTQLSGIKFQGITLRDSTILLMSYRYQGVKGDKQIALQFAKDGYFMKRTVILDTSSSTVHYPLFQLQSNEIVYRSSMYNIKKKNYSSGLSTSDTAFHFTQKSFNDPLSYHDIIPTADGGMVTARYIDYTASVVKYSRELQKQWTANVPGLMNFTSHRLSIFESRNKGYYITTSAKDSIGLRNYPESNEYEFCNLDVALSRIDSTGKVLFTTYYGTEQCNEEPYSIVEDYKDGGVIIFSTFSRLGGSSLSISCDPMCSQSWNMEWLFKVDSLGEPSKKKIIAGVEETTGYLNYVRLYPNPANGVLAIDFGKTGYFTNIEIVSIKGNILQTIPLENNINSLKIDITNFESGSYFCRLNANSHSVTRPFVIQR